MKGDVLWQFVLVSMVSAASAGWCSVGLMEKPSVFEVVGINDLTDNKMLATLLKYDSTHRRYPGHGRATTTRT